MTLCVGNTRILLLDAYKVTRNTGKIDLLKGERSRMEHSIETIHKGTLEHLLNFKCTSGGRTTVCNHLLGDFFGKREALAGASRLVDGGDFGVGIVGLMVT